MILHAINVDNIVSNVGTYNFTTNVWSNAHTLAAPSGTASSEQKFQLTFTGVANNVSSPFLDYATNQLFFGDSAGRVHRVQNVHTTTPTVDAGNFPLNCGTQPLQSPVFVNDQVIVTSADGKLYRIDTTGPGPYTCVASIQVGAGTTTGGGLSAPMVDVTNNKILAATNSDAYYGLRGVVAFNLMFTAGEIPSSWIGTGPARSALPPATPTFDDDFWSDNNGSIYAAGGPNSGEGTYLVRIPYNAGTLGAAPSGYATLTRSGSAASVAVSPITEFLTASTAVNPDFIYVGGSSGTYTYLNRISSKFGGTVTSPVSHGGLIRRGRGHQLRHLDRHPDCGRHRHHRDGQRLLRHSGRRLVIHAEHDRPARPAVLTPVQQSSASSAVPCSVGRGHQTTASRRTLQRPRRMV